MKPIENKSKTRGNFIRIAIKTGEIYWPARNGMPREVIHKLDWHENPGQRYLLRAEFDEADRLIKVHIRPGKLNATVDSYRLLCFDSRTYDKPNSGFGIWLDHAIPIVERGKDAEKERTVLGGYGTVDIVDVRPDIRKHKYVHHMVELPQEDAALEIGPAPGGIMVNGGKKECLIMQVRVKSNNSQYIRLYETPDVIT